MGYGATLWTEFLWYDSLGFRQVLTTRLLSQVALFLIAGGLTALIAWASLWLAWRHRPIYAPSTPEMAPLAPRFGTTESRSSTTCASVATSPLTR